MQIEADLLVEQWRSRREEREDQAELFRIVTDNMLDMVALTDMDGNFTFAGKSHESLGYEPGCLIGKNVMDFVHPEDLPCILEEFAEFVATGQPRRVEYRNRCEDGTYLWFETVGNFITDENGSPQKIVFSSRDNTARKQAEEALRRSENYYRHIRDLRRRSIYPTLTPLLLSERTACIGNLSKSANPFLLSRLTSEQNNGFINVYSEPGHGTTFKIYLPPDEEKESCSSLHLKESAKQVPTGSETVMLVEDEPAILKMGRGLGYTVLTAFPGLLKCAP